MFHTRRTYPVPSGTCQLSFMMDHERCCSPQNPLIRSVRSHARTCELRTYCADTISPVSGSRINWRPLPGGSAKSNRPLSEFARASNDWSPSRPSAQLSSMKRVMEVRLLSRGPRNSALRKMKLQAAVAAYRTHSGRNTRPAAVFRKVA